jgi:glycosyltransferase involved in cell wall biosynthesis
VKILFFSYAYPNAAQPALGTFNRSLLAALAKTHAVRVVSPVPFPAVLRGRFAGRSPLDGRFHAVPSIRADYVPFYYPPKLMRERFDEFLWWSVRGTLERTICEFRPDVILSYWAHPDGAVAARAGSAFYTPVVTMVGGSDVLLLARSGRRRESILRALLAADAVVAVSRHIADTLIADGIAADRLHVVRRGVDPQVFQPGRREEARRELGLSTQTFTLVSVGRLEPVKGHTHLIQACARMFRAGRRFACHIIGDGPLRRRLQQQIDDAGLQSAITLHAAKPQTELASWYRAADFIILPSLSEGVPNVLLESMACGVPWIASRVGGIPEIADDRRDELVPPADPDALSATILRRMKAATREPAGPRRFQPGDWNDSADALCEVLAAIRGDVSGGRVARPESSKGVAMEPATTPFAKPQRVPSIEVLAR